MAKLEALEIAVASQKEIMTLDEVSAYTGFSKQLLYRLTSSREIPFYKPNNGKLFFKRAEIEVWLTRCKYPSREELEQSVEANRVKGGVKR